MVKTIVSQDCIDFASPEIIFKILFSDGEFTKRFHKKFNFDPDAVATSWDANNERIVKYVATTQAPRMIAKVAGEFLPVKEVQRYSKKGKSYTLTSNPVLESPIGSYTTTKVETELQPDENNTGCIIIVNTTLECKGMWGLDGAIEKFMESKAMSTFDEWMRLAKIFCAEKLALLAIEEEKQPHENQECFYDAEDASTSLSTAVQDASMDNIIQSEQRTDQIRVGNGILSRFRSAFVGAHETSSLIDASYLQTMMQEMNDIEISCRAVQGHVEKLNVEMLMMDDHIKSLNVEVLKIRDDIGSMRLTMDQHQEQLLCQRRSMIAKRERFVLLGMGLATGLALGYAYMRVKRNS